MSRYSGVTFVPNFAVKDWQGDLYVPPPDRRFVDEILQAGYAVEILAFRQVRDDDFSGGVLPNDGSLSVRTVATRPSASRLSKILGYLRFAILAVRSVFHRNRLHYIYFPGTASLIAGLACLVAHKEYALYVRGSWRQGGALGYLHRLLLRRAVFIYATGYGFCRLIEQDNPTVRPVVPMVSFSLQDVPAVDAKLSGPGIKALFVGHIKRNKGVIDSVHAVKMLRDSGWNVELTIVGGGNSNDVAELRQTIADLSLQGSVIYKGQVNDRSVLVRVFESADVFVYPSYYPEGFPRVIYEAMLHGLVVLCTILPGMKGFMIDGENCLEVLPQNPESIRSAFERLEDGALSTTISGRARETVSGYLASFQHSSHARQVLDNLGKVSHG